MCALHKCVTLLRIKSNGFNATFWNEMTGITTSKSRTKESVWLSMKELQDKFGSEAATMATALSKRRNPQCRQMFEYLYTSEKSTLGVVQFTERKTSGATKTSAPQHASLTKSLNMEMGDDMLEDAMEGFQAPAADCDDDLDMSALQVHAKGGNKRARLEDFDDADKRSMASGQGTIMKSTKEKKKDWGDKFEMTSEDDDGFQKCTVMHGELSKLLQHMQAAEFETKKAKYQPDPMLKKDLKASQEVITKLVAQLNTFVIQKQATKIKVKQVLVLAVGHFKDGTDLLTKLRALNKPAR